MLSRAVIKQQKGRRWLTALAVVSLVSGTLFVASSALAVHDTGRFQLDGDAATNTNTANTPTATDDWDKVCYDVAIRSTALGGGGLSAADATTLCGIGTGTTNATEAAWTYEPDTAASIFTGGGSKDPIDLNQWAWKNAGGLPDKDNLLHAFAARYSLTPSTHCPSNKATCELLFFGLDRYDNSGDAQNGFWFFQKKITTDGGKIGGGTGFTGLHTLNDVLVVSDFSNGGTVSTISVYTWDPACTATNKPDGSCADANLRLQATSDQANCANLPPGSDVGDRACGLVNPSTITMPWAFTDKSGTTNNRALNGEFYESGINLSAFNLGEQCFSSVLSETRSSTSTTAVLKDFILGQLGTCTPAVTTQVKDGSGNQNGTIAPGTPVTDTATVTVTGAGSPDDATGSVTFYLCSSTTAVPNCSTGGTQVGTTAVALSDSTSNTHDGISAATSVAVNTVANPLAAGYYCFRAVADLTNYDDPAGHTNTTTECFSVNQSTSVVTQLHETNSSGTDVSGPNNGKEITVHAGAYVKDVATVTPSTATGSVAFKYYTATGSGATAKTALQNCTDDTNGTGAGGGAVSSGTASSTVTQFNTPGIYYWRAFFTGTGLNLDSSSLCDEILTVDQPTSVVTQLHETDSSGNDVSSPNNGKTITVNAGAYVTDVATVDPAVATGSVAFKYYAATGSGGTAKTALQNCTDDTNGTAAGGGAVASGTASSTPTQFSTPGTYYWRAFFTGSGLNLNSSSICDEILTVRQLGTTTVTTPGTLSGTTFTAVTSVTLGTSVVDRAIVTGSALDGDPTGTVTFYVCNPSQVSLVNSQPNTEFCAVGSQVGSAVTLTPVVGSEIPPQTIGISSAVTANQLGIWCFRSVYTPDTPTYTTSNDASHTECFSVTTSSTASSAQTWRPNDSITVFTPTGTLPGTITVTLHASSDCSGTAVYTDVTAGSFSATQAGATYNTNNTTFNVTTANNANYSWKAVFTPTSPFATGVTKCETTNLTINNNP